MVSERVICRCSIRSISIPCNLIAYGTCNQDAPILEEAAEVGWSLDLQIL